MNSVFTKVASRIAFTMGRAWAFLFALLFIIVWAATGPVFQFSETWQLVVNTATTIITFLMVFLIQNSQNRDSAAMQTKLDELICVLRDARSELVGLEHQSDDEIEKVRSETEGRAKNNYL